MWEERRLDGRSGLPFINGKPLQTAVSEYILQAELDLTHRRVEAPDLPERRRNGGAGSRACVWSAKYRGIGDVEGFETERQAVPFHNPEGLMSREIPRLLRRSDHGVGSDISHHAP